MTVSCPTIFLTVCNFLSPYKSLKNYESYASWSLLTDRRHSRGQYPNDRRPCFGQDIEITAVVERILCF